MYRYRGLSVYPLGERMDDNRLLEGQARQGRLHSLREYNEEEKNNLTKINTRTCSTDMNVATTIQNGAPYTRSICSYCLG